jgi:hypothetical protein
MGCSLNVRRETARVNVSVADFFTPAEFRLLVARAAQWNAAQIRARMQKVSEEKQ